MRSPIQAKKYLEAKVYFDRGISYHQNKDYRKAIGEYTAAIKIYPEYEEAFFNRGKSYNRIKKYDEALKDYNDAIRIKPNYSDAYYYRGMLNEENENIDIESISPKASIPKASIRKAIIRKAVKEAKKDNELNPKFDDSDYEKDSTLIKKNRKESKKKTKSAKIDKKSIKDKNKQTRSKSDPTKISKRKQNLDFVSQKKEEREQQFNKMKMIATSLFIFMAIVFLISHMFESSSQLLPYIKAFAEAAMIGALADWFAVVALFKKPLGFPYHTAIIPNNKDKMGESLGELVQNNFLTPENIMEQFKDIDMVSEGIKLLKKKEDKILQYIYNVIPEILNHIDKEEVKNAIVNKIMEIKFTKVISDIFELLTKENRHQELLDLTLSELRTLIVKNKDAIVKQIREHEIDPGKFLPNFKIPMFAAKYVATALVDWFETEFDEIIEDPSHKLRIKLNKVISNFSTELKINKELQNTIDEKIKAVLLNKVVFKYFDSIWLELKDNMEEDLNSKDSKIKFWINSAYNNLIKFLETNEKLKMEIDEDIKTFIKEILIEEKDKISIMISKKIKDTPKQEISDLIESYVGKDLQFIRINGTIVGGLVGLLIFVITKFI